MSSAGRSASSRPSPEAGRASLSRERLRGIASRRSAASSPSTTPSLASCRRSLHAIASSPPSPAEPTKPSLPHCGGTSTTVSASCPATSDSCAAFCDGFPEAMALLVFTRACTAHGRGQPERAVKLYSDAGDRYQDLRQFRDAALTATYSVETFVSLHRRSDAVEACAVAARLYHQAGCPVDTLQAVEKLRGLLAEKSIRTRRIVATVRELAHRNGGWLPLTCKLDARGSTSPHLRLYLHSSSSWG